MAFAYSYIRFSTDRQEDGDSIRRQSSLRDGWLLRKGVSLDPNFMLEEDHGISAFRGKNRKKGSLGKFLEAVQNGRIKKGSYFLVENLDRLSRGHHTTAIPLLYEIMNAGITLVTLLPEREYHQRMHFMEIMPAMFEQVQGNTENLKRSDRSTHHWDTRRTWKVATSVTPNWIDPVNGEMKLNPVKAAVVQRIFALSLQGMGANQIARTLNLEKVPPIGKRGGRMKVTQWHESSVYKILVNRACIGEIQFNRQVEQVVDGETKAVLEPLHTRKDYFPAVVEEATFFAVQESIRLRKKRGTGQAHAPGALNLFVGVVKDTKGLVYTFRGRGGHHYLVSRGTLNSKEDLQSLKYEPFEAAM